ncbi:MAG: choice-of-anchor Q domain-containing protein [bacterium]|nr:choice-of-anchor Q domain-containing protein [bacterium]
MKKKVNLFLILFFQLVLVGGQTEGIRVGNINMDTVWASDTVHLQQNIIIDDSATLTILNGVYIEFQGNFSIQVYGNVIAFGSLEDSITFTIKDTTSFCDTATYEGGWGGIRFMPVERSDTSFFNYCKFEYGKAVVPGLPGAEFVNEENMGGCIYALQYNNIVIRNSNFTNNHSNYMGGAVYIENCNYIEIENCTFLRNSTYMNGGGVAIVKATKFNILENFFYKNTALWVINNVAGTGGGSGLYITLGATNGTGNVYSNKFYNNKSVNGAFYENCLNIKVCNNVVANNYGIGMTQAMSITYNSIYANNTIVNNWGWIVPALWFNSTQTTMINNIIWGNGSASFYGHQIYDIDGSKVADIKYSCIENGYPGNGNIDQNPDFVNPTAGYGLDYDAMDADWALLDNSPCINTGTPDTTWLNLPPLDLAGNPRIYGGRIDMGAYENQVVVGLQPKPMVSADIEIAPNPFNDRFSIHFLPDNKIHRITIRNQAGVTVKKLEQLPISGLLTIDLQDCSPGLYVVIVEYANGTMKMKKLLKV